MGGAPWLLRRLPPSLLIYRGIYTAQPKSPGTRKF
jgi:hypothetical protein